MLYRHVFTMFSHFHACTSLFVQITYLLFTSTDILSNVYTALNYGRTHRWHVYICFLFFPAGWGSLRDWLLQGLAVAVTGLQAVTTIQAHWFNQNQALPAALTSPPFPLSCRAAGRCSSSCCRLFLKGSSLGLCCGRHGRGRGRGHGRRGVSRRGGVVASGLVLGCWSEPVIVWFLAVPILSCTMPLPPVTASKM